MSETTADERAAVREAARAAAEAAGVKYDKTRLPPATPPTRAQIEARFWPKVDKNGPDPQVPGVEGNCWDWTASMRGGRGREYGQFRVSTGNIQEAHRVAWELEYGPTPEGKVITSKCGRSTCVRPSHHVAATRSQGALYRSERHPRPSASGVRGVSWNSRMQKWKATINVTGMPIHGGYFPTVEEAAVKVEAMRAKYYGDPESGQEKK